ncbi:MAG: radical SAM protein [Elusimicrobia bacterium]|nr:radical SAM protein [Elusimicrobiota bacterium]
MRRRSGTAFRQPADRCGTGLSGRVYDLEDASFNFLKACDGRSSIEALKRRFPDLLEADASAERLAREIAEDPTLGDLVEIAPAPRPANPRQVVENAGLTAACRVAVWHLVSACDLRCRHCYLGDSSAGKPYTAKTALATVRNLHAIGVEGVRLSGGETTLRPGLLRATTDALARDCLPFSLNSNAAGDVSVIIEIFRRHPAYARFVQVSIDGPGEAHDSMRGRKGAYAASMRNIRRLLKAKVPVTVVSMMHRGWLGREAELFDALAGARVRHWAVELPVAAGRWQEGARCLALDREGVEAMSLRLARLVRRRAGAFAVFEINQVLRVPPECGELQKDRRSPVCLHHLGLLTIGERGLSFCSIFGDAFGPELTEFTPSYYGRKAFFRAWNSIAGARVGRRVGDNPACRACRLMAVCQGGCPGHYEDPSTFSGCDQHARMLAEVRLSVARAIV